MQLLADLDYRSVLLSLGIAGACLAATMMTTWLASRADRFLLTWSAGASLLVGYVLVYEAYVAVPSVVSGSVSFALLLGGFGTCYAASLQFAGQPVRWTHAFGPALFGTVLSTTLLLAGFDGVAFAILNAAAAVLLAGCALVYWNVRAEAPAPMKALTWLHGVWSASFAMCVLALMIDGRLVLGAAPRNWAETLNVLLSIACSAGIGSLSLAMSHARTSQRHSRDALADPLTGLMNRRALAASEGDWVPSQFAAVLSFDLDDFKRINDTHGHAAGDDVLRRFAQIMQQRMRKHDQAYRLGGEEFALVMTRVLPDDAEKVGEAIRASFADARFEARDGSFRCTVSVGIAFGGAERRALAELLDASDMALYQAKRAGRDRIVRSHLKLVG